MYQSLLARRYLVSKVVPLLAIIAVMLCITVVLITWSIMGGFLQMLIRSGRTVTGDVRITWPYTGFAYSDDLIARLEQEPSVDAACPAIESFAILGLPGGQTKMVSIRGVDPARYARVTAFTDTLWWKPLTTPVRKDNARRDPRLKPEHAQSLADYLANGKTMSRRNPTTGKDEPALVMGIEVSGMNYRVSESGVYEPRVVAQRDAQGNEKLVDSFLPRDGRVVLRVLPVDSKGQPIEAASRELPVANEFFAGLYEIDSNLVLMPLTLAQDMLKMKEAKRIIRSKAPSNDDGFGASPGETTVIEPARVTAVLVRGKGDLGTLGGADALKERVTDIYAQFAKAHEGKVPGPAQIEIVTWDEQNAGMIEAVKSEIGLLLFLFGFISLVAVILVLVIFWSMIAEKTRDIGVMRAMGASGPGVAGVWIMYGLVIGICGAALGGLLAWGIVQHQRHPRLDGKSAAHHDLEAQRVLLHKDSQRGQPAAREHCDGGRRGERGGGRDHPGGAGGTIVARASAAV